MWQGCGLFWLWYLFLSRLPGPSDCDKFAHVRSTCCIRGTDPGTPRAAWTAQATGMLNAITLALFYRSSTKNPWTCHLPMVVTKNGVKMPQKCLFQSTWQIALKHSVAFQPSYNAWTQFYADVNQHGWWSYADLHQLRNCSYIFTWFMKIYILVPCKAL